MYKARILIVEDDFFIYTAIRIWLEHLGHYVPNQIDKYSSAIELIDKEPFDLAILDINLSGSKTGIEVAQYINQKYDFPFIFLSSFFDDELLQKITETSPAGYLLKPAKQEDLLSAVSIALFNYSMKKEKNATSNSEGKEFITIKQGEKYVRIELEDILFFKSDHIYVEVYDINGKSHLIRSSLQKYQDILPSNFIQVHRSYLVNTKKITEFDSKSITIENFEIPISRSYREAVLEKLKTDYANRERNQ